jgi:predicted TIM-barrel fold metal-dependent hydrolase
MPTLYNCHTHIFTVQNVPDNFFPLRLKDFLAKPRTADALVEILHNLNRGEDSDRWDHLAAFLDVGNCDSQEQIFELLMGFYPRGSRFVVLSMDMEYMGAGTVDQPFEDQLTELAALKQKYPMELLPFVCADPRRPNVLEVVRRCIEERGFHGIKLYPPLGYYPFDEALFPVYAYAQEHGLPIVTHCSRGGVYSRAKVTPEMRHHPKTGVSFTKGENKDRFTENLTHPANYAYVLERFPHLKLCLAHFGGESEWKRYLSTSRGAKEDWFTYIRDELIANPHYPNVYADIAYTAADPDLQPLLKVILQEEPVRSRVLYGSDFYVAEKTASEREFSVRLRATLGDADYWKIAETNPETFLFEGHAFAQAPGREGDPAKLQALV